ncbi:MAG: WD40 repeat domain-containing protein [Planctomycetales bacterium]
MRGNQFTGALLRVLVLFLLVRGIATAQHPLDQKTHWQLQLPPGRRAIPVVTAVATSPQGDLRASAGDDHLVRVWSSAGQLLHALRGHDDWVRGVCFSPDGAVLASGGDDRRVRLWDARSGQLKHALPSVGHAIYGLAFHPDGSRLAAVGFSNRLSLYAPRGKLVRSLKCPVADLRAAAFSPTGEFLAAGGRNGVVRIWNAPDWNVARDLSIGNRRVRALAYSDDGSLLACAGDNRTIRVFDARSGEERMVLTSPSGSVPSLVFCGRNRLAAGGSDNVIRVWDLLENREERRLVSHTGSVAALAYDRAGKLLISGSFDCTVRLWNIDPTGVTRLPKSSLR